ncbi:MAG: ABC transporter ATP-binding protein [bacterium]|nr:ABC transporter ATP-binding protein [bacterium]
MDLLTLDRISKSFDIDGGQLKVLDNISLKIQKGDSVAITGPSGSGKSTLMYIIGCLDTPTSGKIFLENQNLLGLSENELAKIRNQKIGFVFQSFNLLPRTSAVENVMLPLAYSKTSPIEGKKRALELLEKLGISQRKDHPPSKLSGGEQQRVAIARALINNPSLILADEPTGNLDSQSGQEVLEIFKELNKEGKTIVLVTHDAKVAKICRRIIKIQDGKIV